MRMLVLLLATLATLPARAHNLKLTIVSARLDAARLPHGMVRATSYHSDLTCLALPGLRALGDFCERGTLPSGASPVDSLVRVELKDSVVRTYPIPASLSPTWDYSVVLDEAYLAGDGDARFELRDYEPDGSEKPLGEARVPLGDLTRAQTRTIHAGAHELTYRVELLRDDIPPRHYTFRVPGDRQIVDVARAARVASASTSGSYVLVPLAEGEVVSVKARGSVQPNVKKYPGRVAGPDGIPTIQTKIQYNQPGFRGCPGCNHAALVAELGESRLVIGSSRTFTVEKAGLLLLGINDVKTEDNAGGFDVDITVTLPAVTSAAGARATSATGPAAPRLKKGSSADGPAHSIDPRVVEQIVDAHGPELDACAAQEANPNGVVVLAFAISSDGSLIGVTVERAAPNLKNAGECMRKKALVWRFPPPRGIVTVRYPITFSAS